MWRACVSIGHNEGLHRGDHGKGVKGAVFKLRDFNAVAERIARIQVLCGDWSRCVAKVCIRKKASPTVGIFLDPPYGTGNGVAYDDGTGDTAADVWQWACKNGDNPRLRIVVAGYDDGRELPEGWSAIERIEHGGYGNANANGNVNRYRERLWLSPHCVHAKQETLF